MTNVKVTRTATTLTVTVDLTAKGELSKSGKSFVISSTNGFTKIEPDAADKGAEFSLNLNVIKKV